MLKQSKNLANILTYSGQQLLTLSEDVCGIVQGNQVSLFNNLTGEFVGSTPQLSEDGIAAITVSNETNMMIIGTDRYSDSKLIVFSVPNFNRIKVLPVELNFVPQSISLTNDGTFLYAIISGLSKKLVMVEMQTSAVIASAEISNSFDKCSCHPLLKDHVLLTGRNVCMVAFVVKTTLVTKICFKPVQLHKITAAKEFDDNDECDTPPPPADNDDPADDDEILALWIDEGISFLACHMNGSISLHTCNKHELDVSLKTTLLCKFSGKASNDSIFDVHFMQGQFVIVWKSGAVSWHDASQFKHDSSTTTTTSESLFHVTSPLSDLAIRIPNTATASSSSSSSSLSLSSTSIHTSSNNLILGFNDGRIIHMSADVDLRRGRCRSVLCPWFGNVTACAFISSIAVKSSNKGYSGKDYWIVGTGNGILALLSGSYTTVASQERVNPSQVIDAVNMYHSPVTFIHVLTSANVFLVGFEDGSLAMCFVSVSTSSSSQIQILTTCRAVKGTISHISSNSATNILNQTASITSWQSQEILVINLIQFPNLTATCYLTIPDFEKAVASHLSASGKHAYVSCSSGSMLMYDLIDKRLAIQAANGSLSYSHKHMHRLSLDGNVVHVIDLAATDDSVLIAVLTSYSDGIHLIRLTIDSASILTILKPDSLSCGSISSMQAVCTTGLRGGIDFGKSNSLVQDDDDDDDEKKHQNLNIAVVGVTSEGNLLTWSVNISSNTCNTVFKADFCRYKPTDDGIVASCLSFDGKCLALFSVYGSSLLIKISHDNKPASSASSFTELTVMGTNTPSIVSMVASCLLNNQSHMSEGQMMAMTIDATGFLSSSSSSSSLMEETIRRRVLQDEALFLATREKLAVKVKDLKTSLNLLLDRNFSLEEVDQLERREFKLDEALYQDLTRTSDDACNKLKEEFDEKILRNELIACRIRETCHDSLKCRQLTIVDMIESTNRDKDLTSYAIPKPSNVANTVYHQVSLLRRIELKSIRRFAQKKHFNNNDDDKEVTCWPDLTSCLSNSSISWIVNEGELAVNKSDVMSRMEKEMNDDVVASSSSSSSTTTPTRKLLKENVTTVAHDESLDQLSNTLNDAEGLLYPVIALRSLVQKRFQIKFLSQLIINIRSAFNDFFTSIQLSKSDLLSKIEAKRCRIEEIATEIQTIAPIIIKGKMTQDREDEEFVTKIFPGEVVSEPYETDDVKQARLKRLNEKRLADEEERRKNSSNVRALNDMMYGMLESKKASLLAGLDLGGSSVESPVRGDAGGDGSKSNATDDDAKLKKILEQEIRKLGLEISEILDSFNDKLSFANDIKMKVDLEINGQEILMIRACLSLAEEEALLKAEVDLSERKRISLNLLQEARIVSQQHAHIVDEQVQILSKLTEEDKLLDKSFRREMQSSMHEADNDVMKVFLNLYRSRYLTSVKSDEKEEDYEDEDGFQSRPQSAASTSRTNTAKARPSYAPKLREFKISDIPESIASSMEGKTWITFTNLVTARIEKENEIMQVNRQIQKLNYNLEIFRANENVLNQDSNELDSRLMQVRSCIDDAKFNLDMLCKLRQGQDEVVADEGSSNYQSSILVPISVLDGVNGQIKSLNSSKIGVIESIKTFRKRLNLSLWDKSRLDKLIHHNAELMRDYQLLRVTRNLQDILKGKYDEKTNKLKETRSIERYRLKSDKYEEKLKELDEEGKKLEIRVDDVLQENNRLTEQLELLEQEVSFSDRAYQIRQASIAHKAGVNLRDDNATLDPVVLSQARMKRIALRRKLKTVVHVQEEEIAMLRGELERLRRKTFPSFLDATRERLKFKFPDEK